MQRVLSATKCGKRKKPAAGMVSMVACPTTLATTLEMLAASSVILPPDAACNEDDEDTCPVCYELPPTGVAPASVACKVCKQAVCGKCDKMLTQTGHGWCPTCRAPRSTRRPHLPLHVAIHAFHCTNTACETPQCADAKLLMLRIEVHVQICAARELRGSDECQVCKLWRALNNTVTAAEQQQLPNVARVRSRLRELPTGQVKRMLLAHVRQCNNRRCEICRKMREHIRIRQIRNQAAAL